MGGSAQRKAIYHDVIRWPGATGDDLARYADRDTPGRLARAGILERRPVYRDGRSRSAWYLAGTALRQMTIAESVVETIRRFPGDADVDFPRRHRLNERMTTPPGTPPLTAEEIDQFERDYPLRSLQGSFTMRLCAMARLGLKAEQWKNAADLANAGERARSAQLAEVTAERDALQQRISVLTARVLRVEGGRPEPTEWIDVVFDGPPSHESGRFVEVEDQHGHGRSAGRWIEPTMDKFWRLRLTVDDFGPRAQGHPVSWVEVTRQLGERVARLEAERKQLDVKMDVKTATVTMPEVPRAVTLDPQIAAGLNEVESGPTSKPGLSFADIAKSPEFERMMTENVMRDFVRTDRYLRQLLGPEEYEVMQRRLVMGGPRITTEPSAQTADQREADLKEAAQTVDSLRAKLDDLLAAKAKPDDLARRIRESEFARRYWSWHPDDDDRDPDEWLTTATDGDLLVSIFNRLAEADAVEKELNGLRGALHGASVEAIRAAMDRTRKEDLERAGLVAKLQLIRETLGVNASLDAPGGDNVVERVRALSDQFSQICEAVKTEDASQVVDEVRALVESEAKWGAEAQRLQAKLDDIKARPFEFLHGLGYVIPGGGSITIQAGQVPDVDPGQFTADLAAQMEERDAKLASGLALHPELPVRPWGSIGEQILRDVITVVLADKQSPPPADTFEVRYRPATPTQPPRTELHVHAGKGPLVPGHVLAYVELGELWITALNGLNGYVRLSNARDTLRWPERVQAALDRK